MSSESNLTSRFQKGQKKSPEEIKKREETKKNKNAWLSEEAEKDSKD